MEPNEWDKHRYSDNPKEKPAPIMIILAPSPAPQKQLPAKIYLNEKVLQVHKINRKNPPPAVLKFIEEGGESLEIDVLGIITRKWITSQLVGATSYVVDNHV